MIDLTKRRKRNCMHNDEGSSQPVDYIRTRSRDVSAMETVETGVRRSRNKTDT